MHKLAGGGPQGNADRFQHAAGEKCTGGRRAAGSFDTTLQPAKFVVLAGACDDAN